MLRLGLIVTCLVAAPSFAAAQDDLPPTPADAAAPTAEPGAADGQPLEMPATIREDVRLSIANAYGFPHWEQVEEIAFTFNVQAPGRDATSRSWTWNPRTRQVTRTRNGESITFTAGRPRNQAETDADKQFINDSYWLLFPFQIVWSNPKLIDYGPQPLPIPPDNGSDAMATRKVTVQYPEEGGYTPGDAYDLYLDENHRITQWVFRRGGGDKGSPATWEGNRRLGPIIVSTEHWGPPGTQPSGAQSSGGDDDSRFHLWFTGLRVKVRAEDGEVAEHEPEPLQEAP